jgi:hypothetical protein
MMCAIGKRPNSARRALFLVDDVFQLAFALSHAGEAIRVAGAQVDNLGPEQRHE